jgi:hypothetical protein
VSNLCFHVIGPEVALANSAFMIDQVALTLATVVAPVTVVELVLIRVEVAAFSTAFAILVVADVDVAGF